MTEKFTPTPAQKNLVQILAAAGIVHEVIRSEIVNPTTGQPVGAHVFRRAFKTELKFGNQKATARLAGKLYTKALQGDNACMFFWLKTRAGWRETTSHEFAGANGAPLVVRLDKVDLEA
jgi:hypothetical protein